MRRRWTNEEGTMGEGTDASEGTGRVLTIQASGNIKNESGSTKDVEEVSKDGRGK